VEFWQRIEDVPNYSLEHQAVAQGEAARGGVRARGAVAAPHRASETQIEHATRHLRVADADVLTIGFARRFATYKRATLIFHDPTGSPAC
jgi:starch phosphorylase